MIWIVSMFVGLITTNIYGSACYSGENIWRLTKDVCAIITPSFSVIDTLHTCLVETSISQAIIPYTILTPGNYFLCESVTTPSLLPAITIAADNVYFNLNGHTITATASNNAIVCSNKQNIQILNGSIEQALSGINVNTVTNCVLEALTITGCTNGIVCINSNNININNCFCENIVNSGILIDTALAGTSDSIIIKKSTVISCDTGFDIGTGAPSTITHVVIESCTSTDFASEGFSLITNSALLKNCAASNGGDGSIGFLALACNNTNFINCIASHCIGIAEGFVFESSTNTLLKHCASTFCQTGFTIGGTSTQIVLDGCIASGNSGPGINNVSASSFIDIVDTRSQHAATTINPAYNLNGTPDNLGSATVIITS